MSAPKTSATESMTATGRLAPPDTAIRSTGRRSSARAAASRPMYMVGTPMNTLTFSPTISSRAAAPSKRGSSTRVDPAKKPAFIAQVWPKEWNSGRQPRMTSSAVSNITEVAVTIAFIVMLSWVSTAPLGAPVVPEV